MTKKPENRLTTGKDKTMSSPEKASSPNQLTKTGKKGDVELTENDLKTVSGGAIDTWMEFKDSKG
jgi:bacteriocin-like protein